MDKHSYQVGQIVIAKAGKDKGKAYVIAGISENILTLIDGKLRTLTKPKHKKMIHVSKTNYVTDISHKLIAVYGQGFDQAHANQLMLKDSDIRAAIKQHLPASSNPLNKE